MIEFAYPLALLSLLSIPLVLALHLLRPRRRRVTLSTTALWRAALKDRERGFGWYRRLLKDISLLLLLAIALVLGLALAGPQWLTRTSERADVVLVLDVSASMKTRSGIAATRFDQALAEAARIVDALPSEGRMLVMTSGRRALLKTGFEADRGVLRRALGNLRPGDEAGRPREALALALSLLRSREDGRIYFVTDGAFDPDVDPRSPRVVFRLVGGAARNVAITRFDIRQEPASDDRFQVLMTVRNYTDAPLLVPASARLEGRVLFERSLELGPGDEQTLVLPFQGRAIGRVLGRIEVDDDLAADNQAFAVANMGDRLRVLLFTWGNFYLESVLSALPALDLVKREWTPAEDLTRLARDYDVVVFDGVAAPRLPPGNFLLVNALAQELPFSDAGFVAQPQIRGRGPSALMRDVDLTAVRIDEARRVTVDASARGLQRLFWAQETDLALALLDDRVKLVYVGFDLSRSNFPLHAAFPLFISQALEWLRPPADGLISSHVAAGSAYPIRMPPGETRVIVRAPSGDAQTLTVQGGSLLFDATAESGIYEYAVAGATRYFAVNLTDALESDVAARLMPRERSETVRSGYDGAQAAVPLWPHLLVLALVLLALEWCVWTGSRGNA